ncbi:hypothetical protein ElyMa_001694400 [Elysia marginata]|uniref:Uncharacterized protein n=1 Tax=Elysia marginata TaxID=1093978 RepID=A0AAV4JW04_9GAST|nr:hypothetical protein ElyMa_001694400 [Elysia marginata]
MTDYMMMSTIHALLNTSMTSLTTHMTHLMMLTPSKAELGALNPFIVDPDYLPEEDITVEEMVAVENADGAASNPAASRISLPPSMLSTNSKTQKLSRVSIGVSLET